MRAGTLALEAIKKFIQEGMAHGEMNKHFLLVALKEGYVKERPGWGMKRTTKMTCEMFALLLDGHYKKYITRRT